MCASRPSITFFALAILLIAFESRGQFFGGNSDDLYAALGVSRRATSDEIRKAFRKKARVTHPDLKETPEEKEKAKESMYKLNRAYEVLTDPDKRRVYDQTGQVPGENGVPSDPNQHQARGGFRHPGGFPGGFEFFFQQRQQHVEPIKSKTTTLNSVPEFLALMRRSLHQRHRHVVLFQAYHDHCFECRLFSPAWENLANSGYAYGAVELYRVQMDHSDDGGHTAQAILREAGVSYGPAAPVVFAVVEGTVYVLSQLPGVLFRERQSFIQPMLFDFVRNFFVNSRVLTSPPAYGGLTGVKDRLSALLRSAMCSEGRGRSCRVILMTSTSISDEMALSLEMRREGVVLLRVETATLSDFVTRTCGWKSSGAAKEILIGLPNLGQVLVHSADQPSQWCHFMDVAFSTTPMSPSRATQFVDSLFESSVTAAPEGGQESRKVSVPLLDSRSFYRNEYSGCRDKGCVILIIRNCSAVVTSVTGGGDVRPSYSSVIQRFAASSKTHSATWYHPADIFTDLKPFKGGFVCLDHEAVLEELLMASAHSLHLGRLDGSLLILHPTSREASAALDVFFVPSTGPLDIRGKAPPSDIHGLLADVVDGNDNTLRQYRLARRLLDEKTLSSGDVGLILSVSIPFELDGWRRVLWFVSRVWEQVSGLMSLLPIVGVWLVMQWCGRKGAAAPVPPSNTANAPSSNSTPSASSQRNASASNDSTSRSGSENPSVCGAYRLPFFASADVRDAENGKGFLILIFDPRSSLESVGQGPCPLPSVLTSDPRFSSRVVSLRSRRWWDWLDTLLERSGRPPLRRDAAGTPHFVAVRKSKLVAACKPLHVPTGVWLSELLDGSCVPLFPLPTPPERQC